MKLKQSPEQIKETLLDGICEITLLNSYSVEYQKNLTLSPIHLLEPYEYTPSVSDEYRTEVWDVVKEEYYILTYNDIIEIEQLTGLYAPCNQKKLKPNEDYFLEEIWD
jgi:hypothetical protein